MPKSPKVEQMNIVADYILHNLPFVLWIALVASLYITNVHVAETTIRDIERLQDDVKEMRWEYLSLKSALMYDTKQSEVARRVEDLGLEGTNIQPRRIVVPAPTQNRVP